MKKTAVLFTAVFALLFATSFAAAANPQFRNYSIRNPRANPAAATNWSVPALCAAYNFPKNLSGNGIIGILEFGGGYLQSDLDAFSRLYNMPKINVINVSIDGTTNSPGINDLSDGEVTLDVEIAAAAYYYATGKMPTIYMFFSNGDFINTMATAARLKCNVLSISWGGPESQFLTNPTLVRQIETAAQTASAAGVTIFAASGDNSSSDGTFGTSVDVPACCPHVIGCGGTTKTTTSEVVWGTGNPFANGTGGGFSAIFATQSFQTGAPTPPTGLGRMVPDVAALADPATGYIILFQGQQQVFGGTSCVSPLYSGLFAAFGSPLGFATPTLWSNKTAFVDITSGSNGAYRAAVGPDACTGLGVPNGTALSTIFVTAAPPSFTSPPIVASSVTASYSGNTLTITGDNNQNVVTVSQSAGKILVQGANGTKVNGTTSVSFTVSGNWNISVNLNGGNDALSFLGVVVPNTTNPSIQLGAGDDQVLFTLTNITNLHVDGGVGTNKLLQTSATLKSLAATNFSNLR